MAARVWIDLDLVLLADVPARVWAGVNPPLSPDLVVEQMVDAWLTKHHAALSGRAAFLSLSLPSLFSAAAGPSLGTRAPNAWRSWGV